MNCPHCEKPAPDTNYKCPHCGGILKNGIGPLDFQKEPKHQKSMILTYFIVAVMVAGLAVLGYFMIQQGKQKKTGDSGKFSRDRGKIQSNNNQTVIAQKLETGDRLNSPENPVSNEFDNESDQQQVGNDVPDGNGMVNQYDNDNQNENSDIDTQPYNTPSIEDYKPGEEVDIKELVHRGKTTIFDFYSEFCGPCRIISPKLEQLDNQRDDIVVVKININRENVRGIDWNSPVSRQYNLRSIPHFIVYGKEGLLTHDGVSARKYVYKLLYEEGIR